MKSPSRATTTWRIAVSLITGSSLWAKFSMMTMPTAPASASCARNSRGVYNGLTLTTIMPARSAPKNATG